MPDMEPRISLITLGVQDLERSRRFYRDGLGLPTTWTPAKGVIFFQTTGTVLALYPYDDLAKDVAESFRGVRRTKFNGIALAHNGGRRRRSIASCNKRRPPVERLKDRPKTPSGADTADTSRIPMATCGKSRGARLSSARTEV